MSGFGSAALGGSPYGLNTPATSSSNAGSPLQDTFGNRQSSRYINPRTRRYEYDAHGRCIGQDNVQSLVTLALLTIKGSSAQVSLGSDPPSGVIGANFVAARKASVAQALKALTDAKIIELISVDVDVKNRPVYTLVRWRDLTNEVEQETRI